MRNKILALTVIIMLAFLPACQKQGGESQGQLTYPVSKKIDLVDDYFGTKVEASYRWMEDDTSEEVKSWVEEQNVVTFGYLEKIPFREKIRQRLTEVYDYPKQSSPRRAGEYYFFNKNDGLQNQSVIYIQKGLD